MTLRQLSVYLGHIPAILAREAMLNATITALPHMDEEARASVLSDWAGAAGVEIETLDKVSFEEFTKEIQERVI